MSSLYELFEYLSDIFVYLGSYSFLGNTALEYLVSFGVFVLIWFGVFVLKKIIIVKLKNISKKSKFKLDDELLGVLDKFPKYFYGALYLYIPVKMLNLGSSIGFFVDALFAVLLIVVIINIILDYIDLYLHNIFVDQSSELTKYNFFKIISKIVLWVIGFLLVLTNLDVEITPFLASLGVSSIAIAFALQNILEDIFSSFTIYFDKPFEVGDYIVLGNDSGIVQKIGIKTTRIKTLGGQELIVPNTNLTSSRVENFKRMERRRISFQIGVIYETETNKLEEIPSIVQKIFKDMDNVELDRVHFISFGDFSLDYEIVYYVNDKDYGVYRDKQQEINFALLKEFDERQIDFAYPTSVQYNIDENN